IGRLLGLGVTIVGCVLVWPLYWAIGAPIASIIVSVRIIESSWGITKSSINILMEGTPSDVDMDEIINAITSEVQIKNVHDCHIWTISNEINALSCHAVVPNDMTIEEGEQLLN